MPQSQQHLDFPTFFSMLNQPVKQALLNAGALVQYEDKQLIHQRGSNKAGLSVVIEGAVFAGITDAQGKQLIVAMLGKGHCFGEFSLFSELNRTHDISSIGKTTLCQIAKPVFFRLFQQYPELAEALLKTSLARLHIVLESMDALRRLPLLEKTIKMILIMSYTSGFKDVIPCRQEELANTIGVSRVALGKALKHLEQEGLLELAYGKLIIQGRDKLEAWLVARDRGTIMS
ncbi:Crp/Fnr family transcriptional regulator [Planctobacterium marinum]|uniref:Cyclic nucleotide-binding domain-containing protein n=1 Tax=Planctobacterium marinum TaxID=1631968 RepID=A0AA48HNI8_9ALTE|nr:hypothetical protein MACH26_22630 [Planctobacterium marinum]